ncbi:MAG: TIGR01244 family phosphatase [Erythrobacter sp.]|nr:TIGR01244 family phosphatase [Erythrobacter sp.]
MSDFRQLTETIWASPQITVDDVAEAARLGFGTIINNRPEGEEAGQPAGDAIAAAAAEHGMGYVAIPVTPGGFTQAQVTAMGEALAAAEGKVLAYCRSGTRSTNLWALAGASKGEDPAGLIESAAGAGYDLAPIAATLDMLAAQADD